IAQLPKATFVTRLQPLRLPARAARQLPDQSTTLRVESSSTGNPRLRGALPNRTRAPQQTTYELHASFDPLVGGSCAPSAAPLSCGFHDRLWGPGSIAGWMRGTGHSTRPGPMQFLPGKLSSNWPSPSPQGSRNASLDRSDLDACRF